MGIRQKDGGKKMKRMAHKWGTGMPVNAHRARSDWHFRDSFV